MRQMLLCLAVLLAGQAHAATFVVNSTADTDGSTCGATCTLRQAINAANATATADTINFSFPVIGGFERLIQPATALPTITQPVTINGYSVLGSRENDDPEFSNAQLRIRIDGLNAGAAARGLSVCSSNVTIQGLSITRFGQSAIAVGAEPGGTCGSFNGVRVFGNFLGLTSGGSTLAANSSGGVQCASSVCQIGSGVAERNVIAGGLRGVQLLNTGSVGSTVLGNLVGTDKTGQLDRGSDAGIELGPSASGVRIGSASAPNRLRFNGTGIRAVAAADGDNQFQSNHISDSDELGIDLGDDGVTPNDPNDPDTGPNGLQNFPVLIAAARVAGGVSLTGLLDVSHAGSLAYQIAVYASSDCDASGNGEGERFLGTLTRNLSATAEGFSGTITTSDPLPAGTVVTTTATRASVGTSEFSACFPLDPPPLVVNTTDDVADGVCNAAHCSLRDALIVANAASGFATIDFAIPPLTGTSELLIQPSAPLPAITNPVLIDGYSQPGTATNTDAEVSNAQLRIRIDGNNTVAGTTGLSICADDVTVRGLSITRFGEGMAIGSNNGAVCGGRTGVRIAGNFLGLATNGTSSAQNTATGVFCIGSECLVGGTAADRNVFADGNVGMLFVNSGTAGSIVAGNLFGTDRTGTVDRGAASAAVLLGIGSSDVTVGTASAPNLFRFNNRGIVADATTGAGHELQFNRFDASFALAIDLGGNGVTPNDPDDADGPNANGLQNFPVLTRAERFGGTLVVQGSLDVKAGTSNAPYTIAIHASPACDSSGNGEGAFLLGSQVVNLTQGSGESFGVSVGTSVDLVANPVITATATSSDGTSELSACITATDPAPGIAVDTATDNATLNGGCDVAGDANTCTLREAITQANAQAGADTIRFEIPGDGPHAITPVAQLPTITQGLVIDGYSEEGSAPNGAAVGSDAVLKIEIRAIGLASALEICSTEPVGIRGIAFNSSSSASVRSGICPGVTGAPIDIQGCFFGLSANGAPLSAAGHVIIVDAVATIGGASLASRNVFANASGDFGVEIFDSAAVGSSDGSSINNNDFGLTVDPVLPAANGAIDVLLLDTRSVDVGGVAPNRFRTTPAAIVVGGVNAIRNSLWNNSFANHSGATAIDLAPFLTANGINPNDPNDVDTGANGGQNTPVLAVASAGASSVTINGALDVPTGITTPTPFRLSFYESTSCNDSSGANNGREGQVLLGSVLQPFTSTAESFVITLPVPPFAPGRFLTATATNPDGSTSEFSNCLAAPRPDALFADGFE